MTNQCLARLMKDKEANRGYFGATKNRFFFEYRCSNLCEGELCDRCLNWKTQSWKERGLKKKDPYREYYGLLTEPIPQPFFESKWYESKVKEVGQPSEADMTRARKAQEEAKRTIPIQVASSNKVDEKPVVEKKKRGRPKQTPVPKPVPPPPNPNPNPDPTPHPNPEPNPPPPPPKPAGKRRTKSEQLVKKSPETTHQIVAVESNKPLEDIEVIKIVVRPFTHNDTSYFRDANKNKLYSMGKDKRPLAYVGRWNPETETIDTEFPDSDAE